MKQIADEISLIITTYNSPVFFRDRIEECDETAGFSFRGYSRR